MKMTRIIEEAYYNHEFIYYNEKERNDIHWKLNEMKRYGLVKGDIEDIACSVRDGGKGCIWACVRNNAIQTLYYRLNEKHACDYECMTADDTILSVEF